MNREFNLKYNRMKGPDGMGAMNQDSEEEIQSVIEGASRTICFVTSETYRLFLNYAFLVAGDFLIDQKLIRLQFTSHQIELVGINMDYLFEKLLDQNIRKIICSDSRYNELAGADIAVVNSIKITVT